MKSVFKKLAILALVSALFVPNSVFADENEEFLSKLKDRYNSEKTDYYQLLNSISDQRNKIKALSEEKMTLSGQLDNIDKQSFLTQNRLMETINSVSETENSIVRLSSQIEVKKVAMNAQKDLLKDYMKIMYTEESSYFSIGENGQVDALKLLLSDGSIGNKMRQLNYLNLLNEAGQQMVDKLSSLGEELKSQEQNLQTEREELAKLQETLANEKKQLEYEKIAKENLLKLTLGQEKLYSKLLEQSQKEQYTMVQDVKDLSNALELVKRKIAEDGENFNPNAYMNLLDEKTRSLYEFLSTAPTLNPEGLSWPVLPEKGISAYYHDSAYATTFGVAHQAVDIPVYQGSPVHAPADGVVYKTKDNGYGYSYVILAHANGYSTVYGHVSEILVEEGDQIVQGQILGLSGGMPGTKGAGYMTTGPHLHFELLKDGSHIDPLNYLPLNVFAVEDLKLLPEKYLRRIEL
ncbi:peptidoglycan DD-metalloendopeptidase family protein [Candidatus Gracilibacteria bacterium]|nr:peptidoglycan DD-metalloendopeptidase family protein [Candidatus Gracilibacteria bacterium]